MVYGLADKNQHINTIWNDSIFSLNSWMYSDDITTCSSGCKLTSYFRLGYLQNC